MSDDETGLDGDLRIRISQMELDIFQKKTERIMSKPYQVFLREMITAFNDGKLRIEASEEVKNQLGEIYNVNRK